ncbi:hypothetical protein N624_1963 [Levilactobacillus brevis]|nr:hypothetical protein N624_1963 [Levilactobacillus brevis]
MMRQQYKRQRRPRHWVLLTILLVILVVLISAGVMINKATKPLSQARVHAETVAKDSGHLTSTQDFYTGPT